MQISNEVKDSRKIEECQKHLKSLEYCTSLLVDKRRRLFDFQNTFAGNSSRVNVRLLLSAPLRCLYIQSTYLQTDKINRSKESIEMTTNEIKDRVSLLRDMGISQGLIAKHIVKVSFVIIHKFQFSFKLYAM